MHVRFRLRNRKKIYGGVNVPEGLVKAEIIDDCDFYGTQFFVFRFYDSYVVKRRYRRESQLFVSFIILSVPNIVFNFVIRLYPSMDFASSEPLIRSMVQLYPAGYPTPPKSKKKKKKFFEEKTIGIDRLGNALNALKMIVITYTREAKGYLYSKSGVIKNKIKLPSNAR